MSRKKPSAVQVAYDKYLEDIYTHLTRLNQDLTFAESDYAHLYATQEHVEELATIVQYLEQLRTIIDGQALFGGKP